MQQSFATARYRRKKRTPALRKPPIIVALTCFAFIANSLFMRAYGATTSETSNIKENPQTTTAVTPFTDSLAQDAQTQKEKVPYSQRATMLDEVVITGNKADGYNLGSQLSKVDLSVAPVNTAQDLMRKVPGLFITQHQGGGKAEQIFLRGFDNDHGTDISVNFDGMPVNMVTHAHGQGYADMHFVIPELVENIEYGKGSYYIDRGDFNTSGYVDFHSYKRLPQSMVKYEQGFYDTRLFGKRYTNTLHKSERLMAAVNLFQTKKSNAYIGGEFNFTDGPFQIKQDFTRLNLFAIAKWNIDIGDKTHLTVQASTFSSAWNGSGQIPERAVHEGIVNRFGSLEGGSTSRTNIQVMMRHDINKDAHVESMFYFTRYKFNLWSDFTFFLIDPTRGDGINQGDSRNMYGMTHKYVQNYRLNDGSHLEWTTGAGFRYDDIDRLFLGYVDNRETVRDSLALGTVNQINAYAFTGIKWRSKNGKWVIQPGVRVDLFSFNYYDRLHNLGITPNEDANPVPTEGNLGSNPTSSNPKGNAVSIFTRSTVPATAGRSTRGLVAAKVSPKLNFFFDANANTRVFLKLGMGFHSNDARDIVLRHLTNVDALPRFYNADLGVTLRPAKGLIIQPIVWNSYLNSEFVWNGDTYGTENVGSTNRYGVDLMVRWNPLKWLFFDVDANWTHPVILQAPNDDGILVAAAKGQNFVPLAPRFTSTGGVAVHLKNGLQGSFRYLWMARRPAVEDGSITADPYFVNDLVIGYQRKHWLVRLTFENVFNVQWNQAMFATTSRIRNNGVLESDAHTDLAFTPGTPLYIKFGIQYMW